MKQQKKNTLSLTLIFKNEEKHLHNVLATASIYADEIVLVDTGSTDRSVEIAKQYTDKVLFFEWCDDFAKARNHGIEHCTQDYIMWLDADDVVEEQDARRLAQLMRQPVDWDVCYLPYHYHIDQNGNTTTLITRERIFRNGVGRFEYPVHECLKWNGPVKWVENNSVNVYHRNQGRQETSPDRNMRILKKCFESNEYRHNNRILEHIAKEYVTMGRSEMAIMLLKEALKHRDGVDRFDISFQSVRLAKLLFQQKAFDEALPVLADAIITYPRWREPYYLAAKIFFEQGRFSDAALMFSNALELQKPDGVSVFLPWLYRGAYLHDWLSVTYERLGEFAKAIETADAGLQLEPEHARLTEHRASWSKKVAPEVTTARTKWPQNSIALYCGRSHEAWFPGDHLSKGIGSSETAIIELGKRLAQKGWQITVFNDCDVQDEGQLFDGVRYQNYRRFEENDKFDVLWLWRMPWALDKTYDARLTILDMHDVHTVDHFSPKRLDNVDKIFVKSNYHRSTLPDIADDKFVVVGNGVDLARFEGDVEKAPYQFIYSSSANRGLDIILEHMWGDIKQAFPEAELHVYYGWDIFDILFKDDPKMMAWKEKVERLSEQPGVVTHGRVGQNELAGQIMRSSYWLYPTCYPEIYCVTAREMQAGGCIPITSDFAVMPESVKVGHIIEGNPHDPVYQKAFVEKVIEVVKSEDQDLRLEARQAAKENFSWDAVAQRWHEELKVN